MSQGVASRRCCERAAQGVPSAPVLLRSRGRPASSVRPPMEGKGDMSKRPASIGIALAAVGVLALAACGESAEEEALADVCDANASIQAHIEDLQGLEITPTSGESPEGVQVRETLNAIRSDSGALTPQTYEAWAAMGGSLV